MDARSPRFSEPKKCGLSLRKIIYSALLFITLSATTFLASLILLFHSYPRTLWLTANAIVFSVYKLSSSSSSSPANQESNHPTLSGLDNSTDSSSATWQDHHSPSVDHGAAYEEPDEVIEEEEEEEDQEEGVDGTMEDTWKAVMKRCKAAAGQPLLRKSETWERWIQPRLQREDDQVSVKPELRKSATCKERKEQEEEGENNKGDGGWRTRDVLVVAHDELFRRVENFIKKQHDNLRQESEHRRLLEHYYQ